MCRTADAPLYFIEKSRKKHGILYCTHFVLCRTIKELYHLRTSYYIISYQSPLTHKISLPAI